MLVGALVSQSQGSVLSILRSRTVSAISCEDAAFFLVVAQCFHVDRETDLM
jgi:hypothetical protein